jgi:hypothetical protein
MKDGKSGRKELFVRPHDQCWMAVFIIGGRPAFLLLSACYASLM